MKLRDLSILLQEFLPLILASLTVSVAISTIVIINIFSEPSPEDYAPEHAIDEVREWSSLNPEIKTLTETLSSDGVLTRNDVSRIESLYLSKKVLNELVEPPEEIEYSDYNDIRDSIEFEHKYRGTEVLQDKYNEYIENDNLIDTKEYDDLRAYYRNRVLNTNN